mmetsp:Transcript_15938/g.34496  ORF Transcript_15938/g.34496 Transcript_15938/m.34496 type:complete len:507 (-) Transcript_15938:86-1606(-)
MSFALRQVTWALRQALPDLNLDDGLIDLEYCASEWESDGSAGVKGWIPLLIACGAVDDEGTDELCASLLKYLDEYAEEGAAATQAETGAVAGADTKEEPEKVDLFSIVEPIIVEQQLSSYKDKIVAWCESNDVTTLEALVERSEEASTAVAMKKMELKRFCKELKKALDAIPAESTSPDPASDPAVPESAPEPVVAPEVVQRLVKEADDEGRTYFGPEANPYFCRNFLGDGQTAKVYSCFRASAVDNLLAVKVVRRDQPLVRPTHTSEEKWRRETEILFSMRHDHIVSLYEVWETPRHIYLVMELIEGGDLFNHISRNNCFKESEAQYVFLQLVDTLGYIHSRNVIHRDMKLENILVDHRTSKPPLWEVKISDFGHSKLIDDDGGAARTRVGTVQYWAPEVHDRSLCQQGYDEKVDLWSLGCVLYVMMQGRYPFERRSEDDFRKGRFEFHSKISDSAQSLIRGLIQARPANRLPLRDCLEHAWVRKVEGRVLEFLNTARRRADGPG